MSVLQMPATSTRMRHSPSAGVGTGTDWTVPVVPLTTKAVWVGIEDLQGGQ